MNWPDHWLRKLIASQTFRIFLFSSALFLIYVSLTYTDWKIFFKPEQEFHITHFEDNINDRAKKLQEYLVHGQGRWLATPFGLALMPGTSGQLNLEFHKKPEQGVLVNIWLYREEGINNTLTFATPNSSSTYNNVDLRGNAFFNLSQLTHGHDTFRIIISCSVSRDFPKVKTLLDKISISYIETDHMSFPPLGAFVACLFAGVFLLFIFKHIFHDELKPLVAAFIISVACIVLVSYKVLGFVPSLIYMSFVLACYGIVSYRKRAPLWQDKRIFLGLFFLFLIIGVQWRWTALERIWLAKGLSWLYDTDMREPLFIWLVRIVCSLTAWSNLDLRLLTVCLSIGVIVATYWAGVRLFNRVTALLAAGFVSLSPTFIQMSVRGLRFEVFAILLVILFTRALSKDARERWVVASVFDGLIAGLACLVRLNILGLIALLWIYQGIRMKWNYGMALIRIGLLLLLVVPHLYNNYRVSQPPDPFFSVNIHARYYRNQEFAGQPGFPTDQELAKNAYVGEPISFFAYVFKLHSFYEVINRTLAGMVSIFFGYYTMAALFVKILPLYFLFILGALALLFSEKRMLLLFIVIMQVPQAFITSYELNWSEVLVKPGAVPLRLVLPMAPFLLMITFYTPFCLWEILAKRIQPILKKYSTRQKHKSKKRRNK
jgi:hypothetical protein